jgi:hypothetical protein
VRKLDRGEPEPAPVLAGSETADSTDELDQASV